MVCLVLREIPAHLEVPEHKEQPELRGVPEHKVSKVRPDFPDLPDQREPRGRGVGLALGDTLDPRVLPVLRVLPEYGDLMDRQVRQVQLERLEQVVRPDGQDLPDIQDTLEQQVPRESRAQRELRGQWGRLVPLALQEIRAQPERLD